VRITHTPTNIIQYNEYYPFGLQTNNSWPRENHANNFLYNAGNELNPTSGWYEMFFRGYDPALGRMLQVDPYAIEYSDYTTYNYAVNNPVAFNDPSGGKALPSQMQDHWQAIDEFYGWSENVNSGPIGPGSGNHWSDGMFYSDWSLYGGSETYRSGLAAGMTDIGGKLYNIASDGSRTEWVERNGEYGYYRNTVTGTVILILQ
jgi:RHS repeat-associated protein